jgi:hypothetical protein
MARKIDTDAEIDRIRMSMQFSHPSNPDSGYDWLYIISGSAHGGLYLKDPSGRQIGPFITGSYSRDYILIRDEKTQNTSGGDFTSGDWRTRTLNTEVYDTGNHASISSNQITLAAGTYEFEISCPAHHVSRHQARLYNITDGAAIAYGTSEFQNAATTTSATRSFIKGRFTIAAPKVLEVQHRCETTFSTYGFGVESNFGTEVYTVAEFWKVPF